MNNFPSLPNLKLVFLVKRGARIKFGRIGFSLLSFLFHWIAPFLRRDYYNTACILGVDASLYMAWHLILQFWFHTDPSSARTIAYFMGGVIWGIWYNHMYLIHLINKGYKAIDEPTKDLLAANHIKAEVTDLTNEEINNQSPNP